MSSLSPKQTRNFRVPRNNVNICVPASVHCHPKKHGVLKVPQNSVNICVPASTYCRPKLHTVREVPQNPVNICVPASMHCRRKQHKVAKVPQNNVKICVPASRQSPHFYDFGIFGRVHEPQNPYYLSFETPRHLKQFKKIPKSFLNIIFWNFNIWKIQHFDDFWKRQAPNIPGDPFNKILEIWKMGSISSRKHEMELW